MGLTYLPDDRGRLGDPVPIRLAMVDGCWVFPLQPQLGAAIVSSDPDFDWSQWLPWSFSLRIYMPDSRGRQPGQFGYDETFRPGVLKNYMDAEVREGDPTVRFGSLGFQAEDLVNYAGLQPGTTGSFIAIIASDESDDQLPCDYHLILRFTLTRD